MVFRGAQVVAIGIPHRRRTFKWLFRRISANRNLLTRNVKFPFLVQLLFFHFYSSFYLPSFVCPADAMELESAAATMKKNALYDDDAGLN